MKLILAMIATLIASIVFLPHHSMNVNLYETQGMTDAPYSQPITNLIITRISTKECTAIDRMHIDTNTYYLPC